MEETSIDNPTVLMRRAKLVPVITIENEADAVPLARALVAGGVRMLEVTLRTRAGAGAAKRIRDAVPEAVTGLGTVTTDADLALARELGLPFAFSPGATPALLRAAREMGIPFVPGVQTASELMLCLAEGFGTVKFFPAVPAGGLAALAALAGPFPDALFCPTGGIGEAALPDWLARPNVVAVGGSWLAPASDIAAKRWSEITARAAAIMRKLGP